jgi:hypothetical protein
MMILHRASEHIEVIQTAFLRVLATAAIIGVRVASRINGLRSRPGTITRTG